MMSSVRRVWWVPLTGLIAFGWAQVPGARPVPERWREGFESIREADARAIVYKLAGPEFKGRSPEQPGYGLAAAWIVEQLRRSGVEPGAQDGSYLQRITMQHAEVVGATFATEDGLVTLAEGGEFALSASQAFDLRGFRVAFLRAPEGGDLPELPREDLDRLILIVHPDSRSRATEGLRALQLKAAGLPFAVATLASGTTPLKATRRTIVKEAPPQSSFLAPSVTLSEAAANRLASALGASGYLAASVSQTSLERPAPTFRLAGELKTTDRYVTYNVIGVVQGTDPTLARQAVVVGSHLDHEGVKERGTYWGADDNASGCAANLLAARALALNPVRPRRTVIFGFWSVEEEGLWGSWTYASNPTVPLADTVAYLNMDMVGRNSMDARFNDQAGDNVDAIYAASAKLTSRDLYSLVREANRYVNLRLRDDRLDTTMRSDTGSFAKHKVPVLKAFTGEHPDYHRPTDTPDKLNFPKLAQVARWIYLCAQQLASQDGRPRFEEGTKLLMGKLSYREKIALSPDAVVKVQLWDATDPGNVELVDETTITRPGQVPVRFALHYRNWNADRRYELTARVVDGGQLRFATPEPIQVLQKEPGSLVAEFVISAVR